MNNTGQQYSDETIISLLTGNGSAVNDGIRQLYRNYYSLLSQYILKNSGSPEDAEDIFQEVIIAFVNLVRSGKFRGESGIQTFLYALNRNIWLNELRRKTREEKRETQYEALVAKAQPDIYAALEYRQATKQLMKVIEHLGDVCKKILLMFYYDNHTIKQILATMHYENEQALRNKKSKCLKRLEQLVQNDQQLYQQLKTFTHG
jgi:RNA polymerase sigma factor (sigma-70 family)